MEKSLLLVCDKGVEDLLELRTVTVCIEGKAKKTTLIDEGMLRVDAEDVGDISEGDEITVAQIGEDKFWLSQTETLFFN